jgi:YhcG PDDEXK nuclease domain
LPALRRFVVVELKAVPFEPAFAGQINLYLSAVDDQMRHPADGASIGLLVCRAKHQVLVEYALRDLNKPIGVASWEATLAKVLPEGLDQSLPTVAQLEAQLGAGED